MADPKNTPAPEQDDALDIAESAPAPVLPPELASRFVTEASDPTGDQIAIVRANSSAIADAAAQVAQLPESRHKSLALTALEEALAWANKAVFS